MELSTYPSGVFEDFLRLHHNCMVLILGKVLKKDENGQAMVEFVVVFPVVFLLCLVIMQTFLLLSARQVVNY
ncbi:MAG: pilus assembly protein, partial [Deltaproteobacteria bacterium]|nr:pilus assembly protein [Deltaproteobacteria bacterium]